MRPKGLPELSRDRPDVIEEWLRSDYFHLPVPDSSTYDHDAAMHALQFIESFEHIKGQWDGAPLKLMRWQTFGIILPLFGLMNPDGTRQYREATIFIPRKNGKSNLAAPVALYMLFADSEAGAEVYGAAYDKKQAGIVFRVALNMLKRDETLFDLAHVQRNKKRINDPATGGFYQALSREAASSEGYDAHAVIFDELHTQKTRYMWDVLTTAQGTREQPLVFTISTAGEDKENSICGQEWKYSEQVINGVIDDPTRFAYIETAEDYLDREDAHWSDRSAWYFCNPGLERPGFDDEDLEGGFRKLSEFEAAVKKAREVPARQGPLLRRYFNVWVKDTNKFIKMEDWKKCGGELIEENLYGMKAWGGLDLAQKIDIAAWVLNVPDPEYPDSGRVNIIPRFFVPRETMIERTRDDKVPYDQWVREGYVIATPGNTIDYEAIFNHIMFDAEMFNIQSIGFDRWGADWIVQQLDEIGLTVVPVGQGFKDMAAPTKWLVQLVLSERLNHGSNPVLRWMCSNMSVKTDDADNYKPSKKRSTEKIDGMVATIMALDQMIREQDEKGESIYEKQGIYSFEVE